MLCKPYFLLSYVVSYVLLFVAYGFVDFEDRRDAQVFLTILLAAHIGV